MSNPSRTFNRSYEPVSPVDIVDDRRRSRGGVGFVVPEEDKKGASVVTRSRTSSSSSSLKTPRTARFAEATSVNSPVEGTRSPFADPPEMSNQQAKPSDVGFGYIANSDDSGMPIEQTATYHASSSGGAMSPLKSALKTPGTVRTIDIRSPTFREEQLLEKEEVKTEKRQKKDLKTKVRVRMAKMVLRGTNFACSLIVLSMVSTTFSIFNATKALPPRNNLPPWAIGTNPWPQILMLVISCISLAFSLFIFYAYWKGGHKRAEKTAVYYTVFAVFFFAFSIVMWAIGAGVLHSAKANGNGKDMWGWSCLDNKRSQLFQQDVHYALICRLQNWSLVCAFIEIVVETITIAIYAIVFYRFYSKRRLHKSMDLRDKARSDLYLAQLRSQSAPNTPGFAQTPRSPAFPMGYSTPTADAYGAAENGEYYRNFATPIDHETAQNTLVNGGTPFQLQAPPIRVQNATPKTPQEGFEPAPAPQMPGPVEDRLNEHVAAAPGEQTYDAVPIPGAYASPLSSPSFPSQQMHSSMAGQMHGGAPGQAF